VLCAALLGNFARADASRKIRSSALFVDDTGTRNVFHTAFRLR